MPVHPESVAGDDRVLRWSFPAGTVSFVGAATELPAGLQTLLDDGTLDSVAVEPAALRTTLGARHTWREQGARVRGAVQSGLGTPERWRPASGAAVGEDVLRLAVQEVIDGEVGAYIRSHGGQVELVGVAEDEVEVRLSGACSHCPASDITLTERLEVGIRELYPGLRRLSARSEAGIGTGRRMLNLFPSRGR